MQVVTPTHVHDSDILLPAKCADFSKVGCHSFDPFFARWKIESAAQAVIEAKYDDSRRWIAADCDPGNMGPMRIVPEKIEIS